jgi:hypothetical protein
MSDQPRDEMGRFTADAVEPEVVEETEVFTPEADAEAEAARQELEAEARKYGWKPREEWRTKSAERTPEDEGWAPADKFMSLPTTQVKQYRAKEQAWERREREFNDRLAGIERASTEAVRRARAQEAAEWQARMQQAQREQQEAVEAGDTERWKAARGREDQLRQYAPEPPMQDAPSVTPELKAYAEANQWVKVPEAVRYANALIDNSPALLALGRVEGGAAQLRAVAEQVKTVFPSLFAAPEPPPQRQMTSRVDGGGLAGLRRGATIADLPREAQEAFASFRKQGVPITEEEYIKHYNG